MNTKFNNFSKLMQQEFSTETLSNSSETVQLEHGHYTMLFHQEMTEADNGMVYFSLPDQENYLFEYEGDLDEALHDLPEIYEAIAAKEELAQGKEQSLTPQAAVVIEQIWSYFDQTGEQSLEGEHDYNFRLQEDRIIVVPKEDTGKVVTISRDGQVESSFEPEQYGHLIERFQVAYEQIQMAEHQQNYDQDFELE
jgi:hypothetical protein